MGTLSNIRIEPGDWTWGNPETTRVACVADSSDSLDGTYFTLYNTAGVKFHVWYNTSGGSATDPAPAGSTAIEVALTTDDTAADVASATATAINSIAAFNSKIDSENSGSLIIQNVGVGAVTAVVTDVDTGFTMTQLREGSSFEIGYIDGDVSVGFTENFFDVTAQQAGSDILDRIRTGNTVNDISIAMKEGVAANLKTLMEVGGASVTPNGGTEVTGYGQSKRFTNVSNQCRQLICHPIRKAANDFLEDFCIWRAYPMLNDYSYSGEANRIINVTFMVIPDALIANAQNKFVFGNHRQLFLK